MTFAQAVAEGTLQLQAAGIDEYDVDAMELLFYVSGMDLTHYLLDRDHAMPEEMLSRYRTAIRQRCARVPLQHITGVQNFCGYDFLVDEHVLVPRQDTETLVGEAYHWIRDKALAMNNDGSRENGLTESSDWPPDKALAMGGAKRAGYSESDAAGLELQSRAKQGQSAEQSDSKPEGPSEHSGTIDVLDLCTGSGCILISLVKTCQEAGLPLSYSGQERDDLVSLADTGRRQSYSEQKQSSDGDDLVSLADTDRRQSYGGQESSSEGVCQSADEAQDNPSCGTGRLIRECGDGSRPSRPGTDFRTPMLCTTETDFQMPMLRATGTDFRTPMLRAAGTDFRTPMLRATGTDLSAAALKVARKNADRLGVNARWLQGDLFEPVEGETFDLIVSNPPYIPSRDIEDLSEEVRDHDPRMALDGGEDGLDFYRRLAAEAGSYLKEGGQLMAEHGFDQGPAVRALFEQAGFQDIKTVKDLSGNERVTTGRKQDCSRTCRYASAEDF